MKLGLKGLLFVVCSWWLVGSAQTLPQSTVREIYNFEVGDTFQVSCNSYTVLGQYGQEISTVSLDVIISRVDTLESITYEIDRKYSYRWTDGIHYSRYENISNYSITYYQLDSTIFWYHSNHLGCDTFNWCHIDSIYYDVNMDSVKVNWHFEGTPNWCGADTMYADGLGKIMGGNFCEDYMVPQGNCRLSYYHKMNGQKWGYPHRFTIVNNLFEGNQINISPNPANTSLTIQSENNFPLHTTFQLFDITGRMILRQELADKTNRIDVSSLSRGMYLYSVIGEKQTLGAGKVIIE
jgi:hypothetical protein